MKTYQVTLPDEFAEFVDRMIAEKKWDSVDYLIMAGLSQVMYEIAQDEFIDKDALRKELQIGIDQVNRGEVAPLDMNAIWERVVKRLAGKEEKVHAASDTNHTS